MKKKWLLIAILLLLLLIILLRFDGREVVRSITQMPLWLVLLLFGLQIVSQLLVNFQWYKMAQMTHITISFWDMFEINSQGSMIDSITPGVKIGGEVTRAIQISRMSHHSGEHSAAVVALQKIFSISALFIILLISLGYLIGEVPWFSSSSIQVVVYGVLLLYLALFGGLFFVPEKLKAVLEKKQESHFLWLVKIKHFLLILLAHMAKIRENKRAGMMLVCLSLFIWFLYPFKMYLLVLPFYPEANVLQIAAITFAAYLVAMLPIFPGGLGGFEGVMSGLLISMGLTLSDAAVITIFFRFVTFWFVMLVSFIFVTFRKLGKNG